MALIRDVSMRDKIDTCDNTCQVCHLPTIPQEGRDIEIVLVDGRQRRLISPHQTERPRER